MVYTSLTGAGLFRPDPAVVPGHRRFAGYLRCRVGRNLPKCIAVVGPSAGRVVPLRRGRRFLLSSIPPFL